MLIKIIAAPIWAWRNARSSFLSFYKLFEDPTPDDDHHKAIKNLEKRGYNTKLGLFPLWLSIVAVGLGCLSVFIQLRIGINIHLLICSLLFIPMGLFGMLAWFVNNALVAGIRRRRAEKERADRLERDRVRSEQQRKEYQAYKERMDAELGSAVKMSSRSRDFANESLCKARAATGADPRKLESDNLIAQYGDRRRDR